MNNYYYNLDSILSFLSSTFCPLIICVEGVYHLCCYWSMDRCDNVNKNCIIEFIYEAYGGATNSIKLNCYWTSNNIGYDTKENIFKELGGIK